MILFSCICLCFSNFSSVCFIFLFTPEASLSGHTHTDGNRKTVATLTMNRLSLALIAPARQGRLPFLKLLVCPWGPYKLKQKQTNKRLTKRKTITSFLSPSCLWKKKYSYFSFTVRINCLKLRNLKKNWPVSWIPPNTDFLRWSWLMEARKVGVGRQKDHWTKSRESSE